MDPKPPTNDAPARRPRRLRVLLIALFLAAMAPLFLFSVFMIYRAADEERATFQRGAIERVRAISTAIDTELEASILTLQALATNKNLDSGNLREFYDDAARVLKTQRDWITVILLSVDGEQIINLQRPLGTKLPNAAEQRSFQQVVRTGKPAIGSMVQAPVVGRLGFPVRVPVIRDGAVKYVLTAGVAPESVNALIAKQHLPRDWIATIMDGGNVVVARSVDAERMVGRPASQDLRAALARSSGGWFRGVSLEGRTVYAAFQRSDYSGWAVALGIPPEVVDAPLHGQLLYVAFSGLGLLILGVALALAFSKGTAHSIESLAESAKGLAASEEPTPESAPSRILEVERLREALLTAKRLLKEHSDQRDQFEREVWEQASLLELTHDAIFVFEFPQGPIVYWNRGAEMLYGYSKTEAIGQTPRALLKTFHSRGMDFVDSVLEQNGEWYGELVHIARDGRKVFSESRQILVVRSEGKRVIFETNRDISERRREEKRVQAQAAVNAILAEGASLADAAPKIVEALGTLGQWDMCNMWRWDRATKEFVCFEVWHPQAVSLGAFEAVTRGRRATLSTRMGLLGRVLENREPTWIEDVTQDKYYGRVDAARKSGIRAGFCFPIKLSDEVLGFIECYSREVRAPDPDFVRALGAVGAQLGHFIERKRTEGDLELVSRLPAENPAPVIRLSEGRLVSFVNPAAGPLLAAWGATLGAEAPAEITQTARAALADGRKRTVEVAFGDCKYIVAVAPVVDANYVNLYFTDVTDLRRGELRSGRSA